MKTKSLSAQQAAALLPRRRRHDNKTKGGKSLIIAGSEGMYGSAFLAAEACARAGSGYTSIMTELQAYPPAKHPDFLTVDINSWRRTHLMAFSAIAIGPGLSVSARNAKIIKFLADQKIPNVVLDAGALSVVGAKEFKPFPPGWILTPHSGEMARLLGCKAKEIETDRKGAVMQAHAKFNCVILLKGAETLIYDGKNMLKNLTGHPALAKAGTGDVLTGLITGFLAQGLPAPSAAALGAYVHGLCAQHWVKEGNDTLSLMASDLNKLLPFVLADLRKSVTKR